MQYKVGTVAGAILLGPGSSKYQALASNFLNYVA